MKTKILIAEDHELTRQTLAFGLNKNTDFDILPQAENGQQAVEFTDIYRPNVILMDIVMPIKSGITAVKEIKAKNPNVKILMLTSHNEREKVLSAFKSGADAYCMKNIQINKLSQIIQMVLEGAVWIDSSVAQYLLELCPDENEKIEEIKEASPKNIDFNLTNREKDILKLISEGYNNKDIAQTLSLSIYTVKNHVSNVIQKLAVDDRTQAAILALKENII